MPRIPDEHLACVATLFARNPAGAMLPAATAFLLDFKDSFDSNYTTYLVTCVHCKMASEVVFSTGERLLLDPLDWKQDPMGNDVMAMDITDLLPARIREHRFPHLGAQVQMHSRQLGYSDVGDEIYMLGLHTAEASITPRARFGNISAWADLSELVRQGNDHNGACHIGDMRSRPGFSGSPVFTFRESDDFNVSPTPHLLGIHSAQFRDDIIVRTEDREFRAWAPSSMTIIVPVWTLDFIIDDPEWTVARDGRKWPD